MRYLGILAIWCVGAAAAQALTVETRQTHGVFYAGLESQALMQIKVSGEPGEQISGMAFSLGETEHAADIKRARLFTSGQNPGFAPNAQGGNKATELDKSRIKDGKFSFDRVIKLEAATTYLWLAYDIASNAGANNRIDAVCELVRTDSAEVVPVQKCGEAVKKPRAARVFPFTHRIVPYYRPRWVKGWGNATAAVHLTPEHFKCFTDIVHFAYTVNHAGEVTLQWVGEGADAATVVEEALAEIKRLKGKSASRLIAGFGHMDEPMTAVTANPETRRTLARNMADWVISRGYRGVDIDWEYPDTPEQWQNFGAFLAELREELAGSASSISMAASVTYKVPIIYTTDQLDFLMTMSYDDLAAEHSSMWRFQNDANKCLNDFRMPKQRIVVGLPFYSNEKGKLTVQHGYSQIRSWYPNLPPTANHFIAKNEDGSNGPEHSFNGPALIKEKCSWLKKNRFGGVMIWAYDTDVKLTHKASLARAMYSVLKQKKRSGGKKGK
ncbi:MAG: hypothetical protein IJ498_00895 [Akkermansia sp.]|nr:hypothetical protein [Akkermansia sp.]